MAVTQNEHTPQAQDSLQLDPSTKKQSLTQLLLISDDCFPLLGDVPLRCCGEMWA